MRTNLMRSNPHLIETIEQTAADILIDFELCDLQREDIAKKYNMSCDDLYKMVMETRKTIKKNLYFIESPNIGISRTLSCHFTDIHSKNGLKAKIINRDLYVDGRPVLTTPAFIKCCEYTGVDSKKYLIERELKTHSKRINKAISYLEGLGYTVTAPASDNCGADDVR